MPSTAAIPSARERLLTELDDELRCLDAEGLRRQLLAIEAVDGPRVTIGGRPLVCWCSNDYLGLSTHPAVTDAAQRAAGEWGVGARASRLLAGTTAWHERLERELAAWCGAEAAVVFASGYLANLGVLQSLLGPEDMVLVDRLAHASLIDAARATRATLRVFRHNDPEHAASVLADAPRAARARRRIIVTEGVFSMDGDRAPLAALHDVAQTHEALIYLDDAHGAFVTGQTGRGSPEACGLPHADFLYMGTLGKALGAQGGFLAGPRTVIEHVQNRARTFIYATALAVPAAAAAAAALRLVREEPSLRMALAARCRELHEQLTQRLPGAYRGTVPSHIAPILVGDTDRARRLAATLWDHGLWCPAIRPPTVPQGSARLRVSVTARHTAEEVTTLASALHEALRMPS